MSKKAELIFNKMVLDSFNDTWGGKYSSSALDAEKMFASYGIKLPFKIYYKYKLPDELSPMGLLMRYDYMHIAQKCNGETVFPSVMYEKYTEQELQDVKDYILQNKEGWAKKKKYYVDEIRRLNPELINVSVKEDKVQYLKKSTPQWADSRLNGLEQDFVHGVVFGFSPEDIEYFLNRTDEQIRVDTNNNCQYGVGHVVAPQFRDTLKNAMAQIEMINAKQNNGKE